MLFSLRGIFFLLITAIVVIFTFRKPLIGIMYFIIITQLRDGLLLDWFPEAFTVLHLPLVFGCLILAAWICSKSQTSKLAMFKNKQFLLLLLFFLVIGASRLVNGNAVFGHWYVLENLKFCILFFLIINAINSKKELNSLLLVLIIINTYLAYKAMVYHRTLGFRIAIPHYGMWDSRNNFAASLVATLPFSYFFLKKSNNFIKKMIFGLSIMLLSINTLYTYSRGGMLALIFVLLIIFIQDKNKVKMIIVSFFILLFLLPKIPASVHERFNSINTYEEDASSMGRIAAWHAGLAMLKENPLLGVGVGNFNSQIIHYVPEDLKQYVFKGKAAHNMYIQVGSETGYIGLFVFLLLFGSIFHDVFKIRKLCKNNLHIENVWIATKSILISLLSYLLSLFFLSGAYYGLLYIVMALMVSIKNVILNEHNELEKINHNLYGYPERLE